MRPALKGIACALALTPMIALACPYCAAKGGAEGKRTAYFIGAMITLPFAVAGAAIVAIRRFDDDDR